MPSSLPVDLNRREPHRIDVDDEATVTGRFTIDFKNHGEAVHVHLNLDEALSRIATLRSGNHYVEKDTTLSVEVDVADIDEPVTGRLKIVTGYGTETEYVNLTIEPPTEDAAPVEVDETLNRPQTNESEPGTLATVRRRAKQDLTIPVVAFGVVAILIALGIGVTVNTPSVLIGAGIVVGVVISSLVYLLW